MSGEWRGCGGLGLNENPGMSAFSPNRSIPRSGATPATQLILWYVTIPAQPQTRPAPLAYLPQAPSKSEATAKSPHVHHSSTPPQQSKTPAHQQPFHQCPIRPTESINHNQPQALNRCSARRGRPGICRGAWNVRALSVSMFCSTLTSRLSIATVACVCLG